VNRDSGDVNNPNRDERGGLEPGLILTFLDQAFVPEGLCPCEKSKKCCVCGTILALGSPPKKYSKIS